MGIYDADYYRREGQVQDQPSSRAVRSASGFILITFCFVSARHHEGKQTSSDAKLWTRSLRTLSCSIMEKPFCNTASLAVLKGYCTASKIVHILLKCSALGGQRWKSGSAPRSFSPAVLSGALAASAYLLQRVLSEVMRSPWAPPEQSRPWRWFRRYLAATHGTDVLRRPMPVWL